MNSSAVTPAPLEVLEDDPLPPTIRTAQHKLRLLPDMNVMLTAIQRDAKRARRRLLIETYIYRDDKLGRGFADTLALAAQRGVDVRMIYDPLGSQETDPAFFDEMRCRGIDVRAYRPAHLVFGRGSLFPRDHSRVIVADDHAYTGGAAWGDEWLPRELGGQGWHDVCMQLEGPCVEDFAHLFEMRWADANGDNEEPCDYTCGGKYPDLELLADAPGKEDLVYERYLDAIRRARSRVWMCNAYFYPPAEMRDALFDAAARGVDVQVIATGTTDLPIIRRAACADYAYWINQRLRIFEYAHGTLHAKYAVFDDDLCTVGTLNANPTSMRLANEVNVWVHDRTFIQQLTAVFKRDRGKSDEVTLEKARARPIHKRFIDHLACDGLRVIDVLFGPPARQSKIPG
ncbi:phospholipase D-like domain-containing protein [Chondromyces apiculatus]|uniref:Cardiolipin synthetase n=1 Tax=Chondromyces apiculatus DSM 436 TaxID=1192034 RepID=A0A017T6T7_9BACT|nr:phosphatidylserine/phosphatidylglycerophosphate/cardiolipin synthase family protein [Chondromyces apiculatus]EYF04296.1 Cardiolipin synthetase [Chondromyces apiculatus DSM 436]